MKREARTWAMPEAVPRHVEIGNLLAKRICRKLSIPDPPR